MTNASETRCDRCCCDRQHLTRAETTVLVHVAAGLSSRQAAEALRISKRTVDKHVAAMREKTGAGTRAGLVAAAFAHGIIKADGGLPRLTGRYCVPAPAAAPTG